ncbi:ribosome biogenesis protein BOP1 homolog [Tribolium castaneum]|uniref:Ribosome biogenesis protein BOP1 homolog n=1 Tax=Tribolium castaneum TaxID=7070 RepID=D2A5R4_TRICA|nr:PREDICTED: ribosome biogenesis protein BOP1 homolog [Tribolium castaneum]EFA05408.1 Ribosome biogenesis protein BOP1 homolog-like Protein [Tribolium castaneum]|eukprot:XP_973265.1 PREDICTED: ribosome biogenesis protein BOP1 homolog [Tribolium castaneum]
MGKKEQFLKRKLEKSAEESDEPDSGAESVENEELLNVVNGEDADSSDSDGEIEESDEDLNDSDDEIEESDEDDSNTTDEESDENELENEENAAEDTANPARDEYSSHDTSDEEDIRTTVGNIPMNWYDDFKHLGYDWDGNQIIKPESGDLLDTFLKRMEDPDFWRTVKDPQTGQNVVLSDADIDLIKRLKANQIPDATFDEYAPWIEWFTSEVMKTPLRKFPEHKRSFLPSKSDAKKVSKLVHALKMGWIKTRAEAEKLRAKKEPEFYMLWATDDQAEDMRRIHKHIPAPKRLLPGHAESYNPPPEYLFDEKELKQWNKHKNAPWKRKLHFVPQKFESLRHVPAYPRYIKERFLRCLDLYLCPRGIKMKLNIEPEALVPKLPSPKDLQPFPTTLSIEYKGHGDMVRTISTDKIGQYLVSGSDDGTIKLWEVNTGRCLKTIDTGGVVRSVEWCPNPALSLILVAASNRVLLINPHLGDTLITSKTDSVLETAPQSDAIVSERIKTTVEWSESIDPKEYTQGVRIALKHFKEVAQVTWHGKGDYFATVMPDGLNRSVLISQISRRRSQIPFTKSKGLVQCVLFHPTKPCLFVATQRHVRIYDLVKQTLMKKLLTNSKWISTMAIHPGGDNLLVGTYDRKMLWFDLDLSTKPYQTLRLHGTAVRGVAFHKRYPLFASGSDDKSLIVCHGMVYNDLLKNPLIVPLKRLQDHETNNDFGIFGVLFHPLQPWVFSSGADGTIKLYSN